MWGSHTDLRTAGKLSDGDSWSGGINETISAGPCQSAKCWSYEKYVSINLCWGSRNFSCLTVERWPVDWPPTFGLSQFWLLLKSWLVPVTLGGVPRAHIQEIAHWVMEASIKGRDRSVCSCSLLGCDWFLGACIPFLTYWVWVMDFWQDWFWPEYCWAKWINIVNSSAWSWRIVRWLRTFFFQLKYFKLPWLPREALPLPAPTSCPHSSPFLEVQMGRSVPLPSLFWRGWFLLSVPAGPHFSHCARNMSRNWAWLCDEERFPSHLFLW